MSQRARVRKATAWTLAATVAGSTLLTGGLAARMAAGSDPALAPKAHTKKVQVQVQVRSLAPSPDPVTTSTS